MPNDKYIKIDYDPYREYPIMVLRKDIIGQYNKKGSKYIERALWDLIPHLIKQGYKIEADKEIMNLELSRWVSKNSNGNKNARVITNKKTGKKKVLYEEKKTIEQIIEEHSE